jgi:hypothetical protein
VIISIATDMLNGVVLWRKMKQERRMQSGIELG